jgi:hypothetical protein
MIPTFEQLRDANNLCSLLRMSKACVELNFQYKIGTSSDKYAKIKVLVNGKLYHFSDPNWDIVNKQLSTLLETVIIKSKVKSS